ncbi:hypothetical protein DYB32_000858 [Aphanomyces invadans]|uniref:Uncharacterized protein n=1 Tax=Aphanomyces invadans TaxID=157072 RepID=A0A418B8L1_9STRA|nr:hypothetical protein DYB32_000858 [Aphanomyces invadans]
MTSTMLEAFFHGYTQRATEDVLTVVAVKSVLDDMIADIETWIHETERNALTTELEKANAALAQYAIAERIHWDEKQNVQRSRLAQDALADAQSNLDREVMAYLDAKSQDADEVLQLYVTQNQEAKYELEHLRQQHDAKSQKKVLVKEIRTLRAENSKLHLECSGYRAQLKQLKESLAHLDALDMDS